MKTLLDLITIEMKAAFRAAGYGEELAKVTLSNRPDLCEYQCNGAMAGAKAYRKAPFMIAEDVVSHLADSGCFESAEAVKPGFINLKLSPAYAAEYLNEMAADSKMGVEAEREPRTIMIDYGGPNVAKPLHVGHLRSAIIGESVIQDGVRYDPIPFLLTVPSQDAEGVWNYQTEADVKYETSVPEKEETEYKVVKCWVGDGSGSVRPVQITVDILRDGVLFDTQTLTAENNWSYSWTAEDDGSVWQAVEREIPEDYTVKVEKDKTMFLLTNTYTGDTPEEVPKTGDSSVPLLLVTLLSLSGMVLILAGLAVRGRREKDDE